jgi:hypothetical protein
MNILWITHVAQDTVRERTLLITVINLRISLKSVFCCGSTALVGLGFLIVEVSKSHSETPRSVGLLWMSDRPVAESSSDNVLRRKISMAPA